MSDPSRARLELPGSGLLCVEASAGTGKTHRLSTLAARWLVERDLPSSKLLVVTFTVVAARELRARVRERLVEVRRALDGEPPAGGLEWLEHAGEPAQLKERADRALASFDAITISTIHGFAGGALAANASLAPSDARRGRAVADVLARAAFDPHAQFLTSGRSATTFDQTVELALDNPDVLLRPGAASQASAEARLHASLVHEAIERFHEWGRRDSVRTFADLLTGLQAALRDDDAPLLATLRERYAVGLIDEFQDTDPLQWQILQRIFLEVPDHVLVVVGDPKQAIYGFRGADVDTYLAARRRAERDAGGLGVDYLTVNYRADPAMLRALNGLFDGATLDEDGAISYQRVDPAPTARDGVLRVDDEPLAPLALRVCTDDDVTTRRLAIAADCADEAARLLARGRLHDDEGWRPVVEDDLAVLCGTRREFGHLREAFLRVGIRTTEARSDDVLVSSAAFDVRVALRAMRDPYDARAAAAVAHCWLGQSSTEGGAAGARRTIARWCEVLAERGPVALGRALVDPATTPGLLAETGGERLLTDVQHLFEVLASASPPEAGPSQLLETLEELAATSRERGEEDVRTRRIDTDEPAVRLMTVHGTKGLEFPIVLCPSLQVTLAETGPALWRDAGGVRVLDAGGNHAWSDDALQAASPEARKAAAERASAGDRRRALYVAMTRAKHRSVVWWERSGGVAHRRRDELTALLLDRDDDGRVVQHRRAERAGVACYDLDGAGALAQLRRHLAPLCDEGLLELGDVVGATLHAPSHATLLGPDGPGVPAPSAALSVAVLDRPLRERAERCSFSSLVSHDAASATLDEVLFDGGADDEGPAGSPDDDAESADLAEAPPLEGDRPVEEAVPTLFSVLDEDRAGPDGDPFGGARGTAFGSAVHEALEAAMRRRLGEEFAAALEAALPESLRRWRVDADPSVVARGLLAASRTPIGGGPALCDLHLDDAAAEVRFELPVAPGVTLRDVGECVARHDPDGPYRDWAEGLEDWPTTPLAASIVGSIDLATSLGSGTRFHVVDYKTNLLGDLGYGSTALEVAMVASDYPLQALLYLVALHRLLRWRVREYEPARHLGGAHYLFLRGMDRGLGVASWTPPPDAVAAVSGLFAGTAS